MEKRTSKKKGMCMEKRTPKACAVLFAFTLRRLIVSSEDALSSNSFFT